MTSSHPDTIKIKHLYQKVIPVAPLTLRMLQTHYSKNNQFHIDNKDIYFRRITGKVPYRPADPSTLLRERATFVLNTSTLRKFNSEPFSLGFSLYKSSQYDMCTYLMAQVEAKVGIKEAIENFYYKHQLTEDDYKREAVEKLFYRFRKRLVFLENQQKSEDFPRNKVTNQTEVVLHLGDKKKVHPKQILEQTADTFDVTVDQILSDNRQSRITDARHTAIYLITYSGVTYRQCSKIVQTPFNHFSKIKKKIENDIKFENTTGLRAKSLLNSLFYDTI